MKDRVLACRGFEEFTNFFRNQRIAVFCFPQLVHNLHQRAKSDIPITPFS